MVFAEANLTDALEAISPWTLITIGLLLILLDVFVTSSEFLIWIGAAVICAGIAALWGLGAEAQIAVFILSTAFFLFFLRRIIHSGDRPTELQAEADTLMGATGSIIDVQDDDHSLGRGAIQGHGEWRVRCTSETPLTPKQRIIVTGQEGSRLLVQQENPSTEGDINS